MKLEKLYQGDPVNIGSCVSWFTDPLKNREGGFTPLLNQSYTRLVGKVSDSAQFAVNLAEYRQSMGMMVQRLEQLSRFTRAIIRKDLKGAADVLGAAITDGKTIGKSGTARQTFGTNAKRASRDVANHWLEFSFGWKPLIQDIYSAVDHLQTPIKSIKPHGVSRQYLHIKDETGSAKTWTSTGWTIDQFDGVRYAKQGCEVTITNHNLYLANKLGLVNPATVAWELIPFSFVVDWFVNVGEFLAQGTDFLGLSVTNAWSVYGSKGIGYRLKWNPYWTQQKNSAQYSMACMDRTTSLSGVALKVRPARLWGWQRCANASAVLTQLLAKVK